MQFGLLGRRLGHSYSPQIHGLLADYDYCFFEKEPEELADFLKNGAFTGINVTIPYKKDVIPYCAELTPLAKRLGSVNTIIRRADGSLLGHNTDYFGFETMLLASGLSVTGKKVLVLGSGGASNTVESVLQDHGAKSVVISRSGENNYTNLHLHSDASVIVNTTPVGMYPNVGTSPIDLEQFPHLEGVLDVIFNPTRTKLLLDAVKKGLVTMNGLLMLVAQAKEASEWFSGNSIPDCRIAQVHAALRRQMENIILIGMPGSGKSTVGGILAEMTGKTFVDADAYLVEKAGRSISEIFAAEGEAAFRAMETEILADLSKQSGLIIATGGGCVTREENYDSLHQNGCVFCLVRDLEMLPTDGRPLSKTTKLKEMYKVRKPMYQHFANYHIDNNGPAQLAADRILEIWEERT